MKMSIMKFLLVATIQISHALPGVNITETESTSDRYESTLIEPHGVRFSDSASSLLSVDFRRTARGVDPSELIVELEQVENLLEFVKEPEDVFKLVTLEMRAVSQNGEEESCWSSILSEPLKRAGGKVYKWRLETETPCLEHEVRLKLQDPDLNCTRYLTPYLSSPSGNLKPGYVPSPPEGIAVRRNDLGPGVQVTWGQVACSQGYQLSLGGQDVQDLVLNLTDTTVVLNQAVNCTEHEVIINSIYGDNLSFETTISFNPCEVTSEWSESISNSSCELSPEVVICDKRNISPAPLVAGSSKMYSYYSSSLCSSLFFN